MGLGIDKLKKIMKNIYNGKWDSDLPTKFYGEDADYILREIQRYRNEDGCLEKKEGRPNAEDLGRIASAFSNTTGGALVIGIKDQTNEIKGIEGNLTKFNSDQIINRIINYCKPNPEIFPLEIYSSKNKQVPIILIRKSSIEPISYNGRYYRRVADSTPQMLYYEVASKFKKSRISKLYNIFHFIEKSDLNKIFEYFNTLKLINFESLMNSVELFDKEFSDLEKSDNIIIRGKKGTGKTISSIQILYKFIKKYSKKTVLILVPRERIDSVQPFQLIEGIDFFILWDDIPKYFRQGTANNVLGLINELILTEIEIGTKLRVILNYRLEDQQILLNEGFLTSDFYINALKINTIEIDTPDLFDRLVKLYIEQLELSFGEEIELKFELLRSKISRCPNIGFLSSFLILLKEETTKNQLESVSFELIKKLENNVTDIWYQYYNLLDDNQQTILKSIRLQYEYNLIITKEVTRLLHLKYFKHDVHDFENSIQKLIHHGWLSLVKNTIKIWDAQIESIPLEKRSDYELKEHLIFEKFVKDNLIDFYPELSASWLNSIATKILVKYKGGKTGIQNALDCFQSANDVKKNGWSYFGLGLCMFELRIYHTNTTKKRELLHKAIKYFEKSMKLNPYSPSLYNNLGSVYINLSQLESLEDRVVFYDKAGYYFKKSLELSSIFGVAYSNLASLELNRINNKLALGKITAVNVDESFEPIYELGEKGFQFLPFLSDEFISEIRKIEAHIHWIFGKAKFIQAKIKDDLKLLNESKMYFIKTLEIDTTRIDVKLNIIELNMYYLRKYQDERILENSLRLFNEVKDSPLVRKHNMEYVGLQLKLQKLQSLPQSVAFKEIKKLDKEFSQLQRKFPKYESLHHLLRTRININLQLFSNCVEMKFIIYRNKFFKKSVNLLLKHLELQPILSNVLELKKVLNYFITLNPNNYLLRHCHRKIKYFMKKNPAEEIKDIITEIINILKNEI